MPRGRPTVLTPEVIAEVGLLLPAVLFNGPLADFVGVNRVTLWRWVRRGKRERARQAAGQEPRPSEAIYLELCNAYKKGLAEAQIRAARVIREAAEAGVWQAAAWLLERRWPDRWGRGRWVVAELAREVRRLRRELDVFRGRRS